MQLEGVSTGRVSNFNSILVQLEAPVQPSQCGQGNQFQFHIGAIRSGSKQATGIAEQEFQFHIGAIRSLSLPL